jgi:hypothetical protein
MNLWPFLRDYNPEPEPAPQIPATDLFTLCPSCGLLGEHPIEEIPARPIREDEVAIYVWNQVDPISHQAHQRRTCTYCEHQWKVRLPGDPV